MATLNQLLSDSELAKLTVDQRQFLVDRIDHIFLTNPEIQKVVSRELKGPASFVGAKVAG